MESLSTDVGPWAPIRDRRLLPQRLLVPAVEVEAEEGESKQEIELLQKEIREQVSTVLFQVSLLVSSKLVVGSKDS